jgi:hypothetical protein
MYIEREKKKKKKKEKRKENLQSVGENTRYKCFKKMGNVEMSQ